ncbi:GNAT family N-acetyltransferase [Priestia koreensis]|uniref:GNAT family N-acetyltransferase n=1 Tax=Priestia koreensis TaxID=284581 RepID=UPI003D05A81D
MSEFPVLETERLVMRRVTSADFADMFLYLSDEKVMRHVGLPAFQTIEEVRDEVDWYESIYREGTGIRFGISLKESNKVVGSCGFLNRQPKHFRADIGYELSSHYWGTGIASEAIMAVTQYGFQHLQLERIQALIEPDNIPSQRLVGKRGFMKEGLLRHYEYGAGKFDDLYMYSLLKGDQSS